MKKTNKHKVLNDKDELKDAIQRLEKIFKEIEDKFEEWKEGVLQFEHSQLNIDDNLVDDDRICDGECVWTTEDEDDIQRSSEQDDRENADDY